MSVVLVGGNDRMAARYKDICRSYRCKAKVFTQMPADFENKLGTPDFIIVFTDTCSHKMVNCVNRKSKKETIPVEKVHNASASSLKNILARYCGT